jgi:microsomal dipeptidase-like Zn-dependent dipeptidase
MLEDYLDAIDHLVELVGVDHVGIGTDFTQDQPSSFWTYFGSQQGIEFLSTFVDRSVDYAKASSILRDSRHWTRCPTSPSP